MKLQAFESRGLKNPESESSGDTALLPLPKETESSVEMISHSELTALSSQRIRQSSPRIDLSI